LRGHSTLAWQADLGEKSLHRMLNRNGNPTARNLGVIVRSIAGDLRVKPNPNPNPNPSAAAWLFRPKVRAWATAALAMAAGFWCWQAWQTASLTRLTVLPPGGGHAIYFDAPGPRNDLHERLPWQRDAPAA
jgi:hypothetical protein